MLGLCSDGASSQGGILDPFGQQYTDFWHIEFGLPNQVSLGKNFFVKQIFRENFSFSTYQRNVQLLHETLGTQKLLQLLLSDSFVHRHTPKSKSQTTKQNCYFSRIGPASTPVLDFNHWAMYPEFLIKEKMFYTVYLNLLSANSTKQSNTHSQTVCRIADELN